MPPNKRLELTASSVRSCLAPASSSSSGLALGSPPTDFLGKKMAFVVLARAHELFSYPVSGIVASGRKIKERPDEIKRIIKAGIKANGYILQNRENTIQILIEWLKVDKEMATATYESSIKVFNEDGGLPENGLRLLIDEAKKQTKVEREISAGEVVDLSILREAQRDLGIKAK